MESSSIKYPKSKGQKIGRIKPAKNTRTGVDDWLFNESDREENLAHLKYLRYHATYGVDMEIFDYRYRAGLNLLEEIIRIADKK